MSGKLLLSLLLLLLLLLLLQGRAGLLTRLASCLQLRESCCCSQRRLAHIGGAGP